MSVLFFGFVLFSCGGVHNEPPAEIVRTSGAGPTSRTATATPGESRAEETTEQGALDSTGNPINSKNQ